MWLGCYLVWIVNSVCRQSFDLAAAFQNQLLHKFFCLTFIISPIFYEFCGWTRLSHLHNRHSSEFNNSIISTQSQIGGVILLIYSHKKKFSWLARFCHVRLPTFSRSLWYLSPPEAAPDFSMCEGGHKLIPALGSSPGLLMRTNWELMTALNGPAVQIVKYIATCSRLLHLKGPFSLITESWV